MIYCGTRPSVAPRSPGSAAPSGAGCLTSATAGHAARRAPYPARPGSPPRMPDAGPVGCRATTRALLAPLVLGALCACAGGGMPASTPRGRPNVLLITVDTLRPDHLGCYGYSRPTSPYIDTLARRGVLFRVAITAAGRTVQSFPSILTGVYPMAHGLRYEGQNYEILAGRLTLTRALKDSGYECFAVTQGLNVGLHRDFDIYDPDIYLDPQGNKVYLPAKNDSDASRKAIQWLRGRKRKDAPFFLWVRYNAPHWPYDPPAPYAHVQRGGRTGRRAGRYHLRQDPAARA
ncbi:MAG: hypothetical protein DMF51_14670 [Acidobacteria bacterium]|nr:MAG: hypothetical protein DMF51_14670 [Acidobacteriota bacterium]